MSFSITLFGPKHYFWGSWKKEEAGRFVWFYRPDEYSTGGVGLCIPFLHVVFTWGR